MAKNVKLLKNTCGYSWVFENILPRKYLATNEVKFSNILYLTNTYICINTSWLFLFCISL